MEELRAVSAGILTQYQVRKSLLVTVGYTLNDSTVAICAQEEGKWRIEDSADEVDVRWQPAQVDGQR
jgi:hypothetical protein